MVLGWFGRTNYGGVGVAVFSPILDGDDERNEVVADDEQDEQDQAVSDEHVEQRKSES